MNRTIRCWAVVMLSIGFVLAWLIAPVAALTLQAMLLVMFGMLCRTISKQKHQRTEAYVMKELREDTVPCYPALLDTSKQEQEKSEFATQPVAFDLCEWLKEMIQLYIPLLIQCNIVLRNHLHHPRYIQADMTRMHQMFYYLMSRMLACSVSGTVDLYAVSSKDDVEVLLRTSDGKTFHARHTSGGYAVQPLPEEAQDMRLLGPFIQPEGSSSLLPIDREAAANVFSMKLPLPETDVLTTSPVYTYLEEAAPQQQYSDSSEESENVYNEPHHLPESAVQIVLVTADRKQTEHTVSACVGRGWGIRTVSREVDALSLVNEYHIDLMLIDTRLSDYAAYTLCQQIRQMPYMEKLPLIMLTPFHHNSIITRIFDSGANDYILMPFTKQELLARMEPRIELKQAEQEKYKSMLTKTEKEILSFYYEYQTMRRKEIVERMNQERKFPITIKTLGNHVTNILKKIDADSIVQAAIFAKKHNCL